MVKLVASCHPEPPMSVFALFANGIDPATAGWTTKEVLIAVGSTAAVLIPVVWGLVHFLAGQYREHADRAEKRAAGLERLVNELKEELAKFGGGERLRALEREFDTERMMRSAAEQEVGRLTETVTGLEKQVAGLRLENEGLVGERNALAAERDARLGERDDARAALAAEQKRILKAADRDGLTWSEKVLKEQFVPFKPLDHDGRTTPIISVLNLKGGVGKTTATAHLGAALADRGYRVLLIDLDLQGSLTEYYTTTDQLKQLYQQRRLLPDFLERSFDAEFPNLNEYTTPILPGSKSALVPTTDVMAYAELNLTVRWFLRDSNRDPRFLLRKELHLKRITERYDLVLIDCPPLANTSCVNALVASDYVLTPVLPSKQVTDRANILFKLLRDFQEHLNPHLRLLGFFANRTERAG
jgi:chromosome partitioning protein